MLQKLDILLYFRRLPGPIQSKMLHDMLEQSRGGRDVEHVDRDDVGIDCPGPSSSRTNCSDAMNAARAKQQASVGV